MRKVLCLVLALIFAVVFTSVSLAESEDITDDATAPGSAETVTVDMYDEETPFSPPNIEEFEEPQVLEDSDVPAAAVLAQTGGFPVFVFYIAGGICILIAIILATRKGKEDNAG